MVCALSHVALGFAVVSPVGGKSGSRLSSRQLELCSTVQLRVQSMRRLLCKESVSGPGLTRLMGELGSLSGELCALELVPYSRLRVTDGHFAVARATGPSGRPGAGGRPGPLIADRIDFPSSLGNFNAEPFLCAESYMALVRPDCLLLPDDDLAPIKPMGKMASPEELVKLARRWDAVGSLVLLPASSIDSRDIADCFPVLKSGGQFPEEGVDRQILDRRRRNARERRIVSGSRFMPHSVLLGEIFLAPFEKLLISADDLRNCYHLIVGSPARATSTFIASRFNGG